MASVVESLQQQALVIRVLVVDDVEIVQRGICQILQSQADIEIIGELRTEPTLFVRFASTNRRSCCWT